MDVGATSDKLGQAESRRSSMSLSDKLDGIELAVIVGVMLQLAEGFAYVYYSDRFLVKKKLSTDI